MEADTAPVTTPIDPRTRKNPYRTPPKYPLGERGFSGAGTYPRIGPFEIQRQRPLRNREAQRDGRAFYMLAEYAEKTPPPEGWSEYLAGRYGAGTYRILHHGSKDPLKSRALFYVDEAQVARMDRQHTETKDDDDPLDNPPPADPIGEFVRQLGALRQAESLLRPEAPEIPPPPPPPGFAETLIRSIASNPQLLAQLAQQLAPRINPPAPPAPSDPAGEIIARFVKDQGLTPEEAIDALTGAAIAKRESAPEPVDRAQQELALP